MPNISLADIQKAADKKYGDYVIPVEGGKELRFKNPMRMSRDIRRKLADLFDVKKMLEKAEANPDLDVYDLYREAFELTAVKPAHFAQLDKAVGDDPAIWTLLFEEFGEATEAGEASPSED